MARSLALVLFVVLATCAWLAACGSSDVPSPFTKDAGADVEIDADAGEASPIDPTIGPPCVDDPQCNDEIECTTDFCDHEIAHCRFVPDDTVCQDDVYCDGLEVCEPKFGCREGDVVACDDKTTCTIDTCIEADKSCTNVPRDVDQDGDPDWNCGGGDCNDTNNAISSQATEVCANGVDDDCDTQTDETGCKSPAHDTCVDALTIEAPGKYTLPLAASASDYSASCIDDASGYHDVVAAIVVPAGPAIDVDIRASVDAGQLALATAGQCGDPSSEIACNVGISLETGGVYSRILLRSVAPGAYPVFVFGTSQSDVTLDVKFLPASAPPTNETCGTAIPLAPATPTLVSIVDAVEDIASDCVAPLGELVYSITLAQPQDVHGWASSNDGVGKPVLSLLDGPCVAPSDELACNQAAQAHVFARALPAGTYYLALSATAPSDIELLLELLPPSTPPADETCTSGALLVPNQTLDVPLAGHTDDHKLGCIAGAVDAAYTFDITQDSDVLVVARSSDNDTAAVAIANAPCTSSQNVIECASSTQSPVRAGVHKLAAGSYRAVVESMNGAPTFLTAFTRPKTAPILVAFADTCDQAVNIPPQGGFFQGNTANVNADYAAGCDLGGQSPGGGPDQMLKLTLAAKKRVILDMKGSTYNTLLTVRKASSCPGPQVELACAAGYANDRSYLDVTLDPGSYYVQIDGYASAAGSWFLEAFVVDP
jgi:hypothetical protein